MSVIRKTPTPASAASPAASNSPDSERAKLRGQARELILQNPGLRAALTKAEKSHGKPDAATIGKVTAEVASALAKSPYWSKQPPAAQKAAAGRYAGLLLEGSKSSSGHPAVAGKSGSNPVLDQANKLVATNPGLSVAISKAALGASMNGGSVSPATARTLNGEVAKAVSKNPYWSKQPVAAQQEATKNYTNALLDSAVKTNDANKMSRHFSSLLKTAILTKK